MKARKKEPANSLLTRLFKSPGTKKQGKRKAGKKAEPVSKKKGDGKKAGKPAASEAQAPPKARPLTGRQRSLAEIKQMKHLGEKDPERLARLLVTMLGKEREKERAEKERLDQMVWDILNRNGRAPGKDGGGQPPPE